MSIADTDELFSRVVEQLLKGAFICEYSDEDAYKYLSDPGYAEQINKYVRRLGRILASSSDGLSFFLVFVDVDSSDRRQAIRKQFKEVINQLEPLVRLLALVRSARQDETPISPGDQLRQGELLITIESTPALREDLGLLVRGELFKTVKSSTRDQLSHILDKLCDLGYLRRNTSTGSDYTAMGRWSYLYDVMDFVASHEQIEAIDEAPAQEQLL